MSSTKRALGSGKTSVEKDSDYESNRRGSYLLEAIETAIDEVDNKKTALKAKLIGIQQVIEGLDPANLNSIDVYDRLKVHSSSKIYYELLQDAFAVAGITPIESLLGEICGMDLYGSKPLKVDGLKVPSNLHLLGRFPTSKQNEMAKLLQEVILVYMTYDEYKDHIVEKFVPLWEGWQKFIEPIINPQADSKKSLLYGQIHREINSRHIRDSYDERIAPNVADLPHKCCVNGRPNIPMKIVPHTDWFPESLKDLKPEHIVAIFPPTELKVFMLLIGRGLIGASGSKVCGYNHAIKHSSRIAGLLKGPAGSGKSELFKVLDTNAEVYGYITQYFRNLDDRFGLGDQAEANFVLKDDTSNEEVLTLLKSGTFNSFVVGNPVCAEKKGRDATYVKPRGVVLVATNHWDPNNCYICGEGNRSRIRILDTIDKDVRDLQLQKITDKSHPWHGCESLTPLKLVPHLANKYGVSEAAIMGWFFRQCADYFYESIPNLEQIDKKLESKLSTRVAAPPLKGLVKALKLTLALKGRKWNVAMNSETLIDALTGFNRLLMDCRSYDLLCCLKEAWEARYRSQEFLWTGFRDLRYSSIEAALAVAQNACEGHHQPGQPNTLESLLVATMPHIRTWGGISVGKSPSNFLTVWNSPDSTNEIEGLLPKIKDLLPANFFDEKDQKEDCRTWYKPWMLPADVKEARAKRNRIWQDL